VLNAEDYLKIHIVLHRYISYRVCASSFSLCDKPKVIGMQSADHWPLTYKTIHI